MMRAVAAAILAAVGFLLPARTTTTTTAAAPGDCEFLAAAPGCCIGYITRGGHWICAAAAGVDSGPRRPQQLRRRRRVSPLCSTCAPELFMRASRARLRALLPFFAMNT